MDIRKSKVEASCIIPGVAGKNIGPGAHVDLDEVVGNGQRVRDLFPEEWFEPAEAQEQPAHAEAEQHEERE